MDERTDEMLSRYIDGDLSDAERASFEKRLDDDETLHAELRKIEQLRSALRTISRDMEPPAELDRVLEPMLQGPPAPALRVRPVYRWLGAAAAVVLGVTVAVEMVQRHPGPGLETAPVSKRVNPDEREIFELAPLPSAVPREERSVGAADRLLDEEPAAPQAPEPDALEIIGPLNERERRATAGASAPAAGAIPPSPQEATTRESVTGPRDHAAAVDAERQLEADAPDLAARSGKSADGAFVEKSGRKVEVRQRRSIAKEGDGIDEPVTIAVILEIGGETLWVGRSTPCDESTWDVEVTMHEGVVVTVAPMIDGVPDHAARRCRPLDLTGVYLEGLPAGSTVARIIVK